MEEAKHVKEAFLAEALGHAVAEDVISGDDHIILTKGTMIDARTVGYLASQGIDRVAIFRKPRISVIVIGRGLISPGVPLAPGMTYDFGTEALKAALDTMRIRPVFMRRLSDEPKMLHRVVSFALNHSDMIILVIKEVEQGILGIKKFLEDMNKEKKPMFCLSYDSELIFEYFEKLIRPSIQSFMGYRDPDPA